MPRTGKDFLDHLFLGFFFDTCFLDGKNRTLQQDCNQHNFFIDFAIYTLQNMLIPAPKDQIVSRFASSA
jgi:hypothetical protein